MLRNSEIVITINSVFIRDRKRLHICFDQFLIILIEYRN